VSTIVKVINKADYLGNIMCVPGKERRLAGWRWRQHMQVVNIKDKCNKTCETVSVCCEELTNGRVLNPAYQPFLF